MALKGDFDMSISMDIKTLNELTKIFPNIKIKIKPVIFSYEL